MAICIEPMFNLGTANTKVDSDGWTVRTADGKKIRSLGTRNRNNGG